MLEDEAALLLRLDPFRETARTRPRLAELTGTVYLSRIPRWSWNSLFGESQSGD